MIAMIEMVFHPWFHDWIFQCVTTNSSRYEIFVVAFYSFWIENAKSWMTTDNNNVDGNLVSMVILVTIGTDWGVWTLPATFWSLWLFIFFVLIWISLFLANDTLYFMLDEYWIFVQLYCPNTNILNTRDTDRMIQEDKVSDEENHIMVQIMRNV